MSYKTQSIKNAYIRCLENLKDTWPDTWDFLQNLFAFVFMPILWPIATIIVLIINRKENNA
ncbi:hypothetical protein FACS1894110_09940 [Spirochaetia bacterium]|nr:hypothetical protein FACS1894110_09940 [Spirochaetia bacterium]